MRILPFLALLMVAVPASAQGTGPAPLTLQQAWEVAPDASAAVLAARATLASARRARARVAADPQSLRVDRIGADNDLANAQRALDAALAANEASVTAAYFGALEADTALAVSELDAAIELQTLQAEQARQQAGAATDLDVAKAQNAYRQAQASAADARTRRTLAYNTLASLLGRNAPTLTPVTEAPPLGELDAYRQRAAEANAQLVAARNAEALTRAQLQATDNDFSSRSAIQQAQDALADAERHVTEVTRTLELSVNAAYANAQAAGAALANALAADATAQQDLDAAKARLDAGSISPLAYRSGELTRRQAAQSLETARHAAILRRLELDRTVLGG